MEDLEIKFETQLGTISTSPFEAIRNWVSMAVEGNRDVVVTAENLKDSKATVASYRKLKTALEDERKRIKREWARPYEDWEKQYKESVIDLDDTIDRIGSQIRAIEDEEEKKRISEVESEILKDANDIQKGLGDLVKNNATLWNMVAKQSYFLKSTSRIKSQEEWRTTLLGISRDIEFIKTVKDSDLVYLAYLDAGNLTAAMQKVADDKRKLKESKPTEKVEEIEEVVEEESKTLTVELPDMATMDPSDMKKAKALRWIVGDKWKIKVLFKVGAMLGLTFANYEENR